MMELPANPTIQARAQNSARRTLLVCATTLSLIAGGLAGCSKEPAKPAAPPPPNPRTTGSLLVKSNRSDATVEASRHTPPGEVSIDSLPLTVGEPQAGLAPGTYTVTARVEGWPDLTGDLAVAVGRTAELTLNFPSGSLRLDSLPTGTKVRQGDTLLGETPLTIPRLPPGPATFTFEYPSWPLFTFKTTVVADQEVSELARLPHGKLSVATTPAGATVLQDKRVLGRTPLSFDPIPAGVKKLTIQATDFPTLQVAVTVEDDREASIDLEMAIGFPLLDPAELLRAVWVPDNPDRLSPNFDQTGRYAPKNGVVKNLNRKKLFVDWLGRKYRIAGSVRSYDRGAGEIELTEDRSELSRYRILIRLSGEARANPDVVTALVKGAEITLYGQLDGVEEPRWPSKVITFNVSAAELMRGKPAGTP